MSDDCELLFFDTFSHDSCEELNLDLVQFPHPVYIFEIRVIPLGARVQADFPGGHRLGVKTEHDYLLKHLHRFGLVESPTSPLCSTDSDMSGEHLNSCPGLTDIVAVNTAKDYGFFKCASEMYWAGRHRVMAVMPSATNPSSFSLEFFVNDLSKRSASTFERLGSLDYKQNVDIQFPVPNKIPTDGLVLRGWYSAVTLAVYGVITKITKERSSPPPPPPPQSSSRQTAQEHCSVKDFGSPVSDVPMSEWERQPRMGEVPPEPPPPPVRAHQQVVEGPRFVEVSQMIHQPPEPHVTYSTELPPPVIGGFSEPPPPIVYQECVSVPVPQVPATPAPYGQYEAHYSKPWPPPEEQYQQPPEPYDHQMYNRPQDNNMYQPPPPDSGHQMWDPNKDHHGPSEGHDHEGYGRSSILEHPSLHRDKDMGKDRNRDRPWDRDIHDYKDDDIRSRDHDKRKDRDRRSRETSWERSSVDSDRYRDRDRDRMSRDRERDRDRNRDRGSFMDRGPRKELREAKRPTTPPSPRKIRPHTPQTPPEVEKMISGPRTPKEEEPMDVYDVHIEGEIQDGDNTEDDGYEEIVSEEEIMSDIEDRPIDIGDIDYDLSDETWNFMSSFSPYTCELTSCQHFSDPVLFSFEIAVVKHNKEKAKSVLEDKNTEALKTFEMLNQVDGQEHTEKWVETLEAINESTLITLSCFKSQEKFKDAIDLLIKWTLEGLDFELSLNQPQTAYKVRHLKAGIRLATLLFQTNCDIIQKLLDKDIPKCLLQLFDQPYMVLPVKLLILRGLDVILSTKAGLNYIVNKAVTFTLPKVFDFNIKKENMKNENIKNEKGTKTCYQKLLEILMSKQLTRVVASLSTVLNKIHIYEVLLELSDCVDKLVQNTQINESKSIPSESPENVEVRAPSVDSEVETDLVANSCDSFTPIIIACIQEITASYHNAWKQMAQMKRFLPAQSQFEFPKSPYNPYPGLLRIFKENKLLENVFVLLSSPTLSGHPIILTSLKDLFKEFLSSQEGMLFLLSAPDTVNGIQRALLHTEDEAREETTEENIAQNFGMQISYHLQALLYVDCLMAYHVKGGKKDLDDADTVSALHHLYTMLFSPVGRLAVIDVLTTAENLNALLPFVQISGEEPNDVKRSKSVCAGYVTELLMLVVHYSEDVSTLEKFSDALFNLSQQDTTPKLHDLGLWMSPTREIQSYTHEAVGSLMNVLKAHVEDAASLRPELITALRILQHITLPKEVKEENEELKYMYAIIQVFSNDGMDSLKGILQNVADSYLKPSHQSSALVGLQGVLVVAVVKPAMFILKSILAYLISSRGTEFKDLTAVPVLLKVYSLMLLVPPSAYTYHSSQLVQAEIIEALLTYTQPFLGSAESEEALSKSLWTEMIQEILKYTKLSPSTFVTGLTILSELLPLPLPLQTREPLSEDEVIKMVNYRKLWSAHLHSLSGTIQEVIVSLSATSCHPLQQLLRRVCVQLADLAAPTALFIVKAVLDALLEVLILPPPEQKENLDPTVSTTHDTTPMLKTPTSTTARILNLVAYLVSHASFKIPMMHVMRGSVKADEKYLDVLPLMLELFNTPSEKAYVIQSHECIVSILQSLCDPDVGFITYESGVSINEVLASSLPCKEHISQICGALVQHIGCHQHSYSSVLPSLRCLVMLTEHDYGFYHVKHGLEQHPGAVFSLFTRFSLSFSKDSSDCLSTLSTTLEFLRLMVNGYEDGGQTGRSLLLSTTELAELLRGEGAKSEKDKSKAVEPFQPVVELAKLLEEFGNDEEAVESLLESISGLLSLLNNAPSKDTKSDKEITEPVLPQPESQSAQFASRPVFIIGEVEEGRLSPAYWLSLPAADDADQEQEQVPVDLISIAEKTIPGDFDLKVTLESLCLSTDGEADIKSKKTISIIGGKRKYQPLVNPALTDVNNKRPFIAPMRGRGFTRATSHSSRANDPFRSRPPNTSRPPSMHVDDFVALESHHSGSNSQTPPKRPAKENSRGRGRGFERNSAFASTRGAGGRFFSPPGPYGRRESNRGGNRGTSRISNNAWNNRSNPNSGQKLSPGAGQRTSFGSHRCDYNSPFNPSETRPSGQRNRDPYSDIGRTSNVISVNRFRGSRPGGMGQAGQGHWQDRNKGQNQRFITPGNPSRGSGRRDLNARHNRSFTR